MRGLQNAIAAASRPLGLQRMRNHNSSLAVGGRSDGAARGFGANRELPTSGLTKMPNVRKSSIAISIVLAGFTLFVIYSLLNISPVSVVESHLQRSGDQVCVVGELSNASRNPAPIDLEVHYFDSAGRAIGQNMVSLDAVPGRHEFRTPPMMLGGVSAFSLYLNHGRNPYGN